MDAAVDAIRYHRRILEALLNRHWDQAKEALALHIRHNHPVLSPDTAKSLEGSVS